MGGRRDEAGPYETLFEHVTDGVLLTEPGGAILRANPAACRMLGRSEAELARVGRAEVVVADAALERALRERARSGVAKAQLRFRRPDGTTFPAEVTSALLPTGDPAVRSYVIFRDVSERERAERELRESERRLRLFVEHAPAAIAMFDRDMRYLAASRRWLVDYRLGAVELEGRSHYEVFPDLPERWREIHRRCLAGAVEAHDEDPFPRGDGTVDWVRWAIHPWRDDAGEVGGLILLSEVVTDRKRAELALRASEARLNAVLENLGEGLILADLDARFTLWNRAALEMHGFADPSQALRALASFAADYELSRDGVPLAVEEWPLSRVLRGEALRDEELRVRRRDGSWERIFSYGGALVPDASGRPQAALLSVRDVTEERRLRERVEQSQKLESIGRLAGGVAHDFNNLLTVILSCAEALRDDVAAGRPAGAAEVEDVARAGGRAAELTRQLLTFARKQVSAQVPLDLNAALRGAQRLLARVLGEDVRTVELLDDALWTVRCDPVQLEQVVLNLAVNARDAMPAGGTLVLETKNVVVGAAGVPALPELPPGEYVRLAVRDDGHGMTAEVKAHLFEPFFTTKPKGAGTGLGLATVYGIVKQSRGHVAVESAPGLGTSVEIYLPREGAAASAAGAPGDCTAPTGTERVLLVEDDPLVRDVTARALAAGGYDVVVTADASAALAAAAGRAPDLLVTDVVMPGQDGRALAGELQRRHPGLRVLFVSGYSDEALGKHGVLEPGLELLAKPFTPSSLLARVRAVLDRR